MASIIKCQVVILLGVALSVVAACFGWQHYSQIADKLRQATVLTAQQAKEVKSLQEQLKISQGNAEALQADYEQEKSKPAATFRVQAQTLSAAAKKIEECINNNDEALPPMALGKSDRTVVVVNETDYKVDVLKINLDKVRFGMNVLVLAGNSGEIGAGPSWKNRDNAINAGYTDKKRIYAMWVRYF